MVLPAAGVAASSKRKLSHVSKACSGCRRRRSKCDGSTPCSEWHDHSQERHDLGALLETCGLGFVVITSSLTTGLYTGACALTEGDCIYGSAPDGRKAASKTYVDALHQRIRALELMLDQAGLPHGGDPLEGPAHDVGEPAGKGKGKGKEITRDSGDDSAIDAIEMLKIDDDTGDLRYYGPQSHFVLPSLSKSSAADPGGSQSPEVYAPSASSPHSLTSQIQCNTPGRVDWGRHLPLQSLPGFDENLHEHLLDLFFNYFNEWCGWTSGCREGSLFRRDMARCLGSPDAPGRTSYYSPMLHNAILSLGVVFCTDPRVASIPAAFIFATAAKEFLEAEVERPLLSTMQGLMTLGSVHSGSGRHGLGYYFANSGIKLGTTLGLGIDSTPWLARGLLTQETKDERDRAFFCGFIQDKLWAMYVGRPASITSSHFQARLPTIFKTKDDELWHTRIQSEGVASTDTDSPVVSMPSYASTTFHHTSKLAMLAYKLLETIYALEVDLHSPSVKAAASDLTLQLGIFYDSLPPAITISPHSNKNHPSHVIVRLPHNGG